jgi:hypothetical protein
MKISDYPDLLSDDEFSFLIAADWLEERNRDYEAWCLRQGYVFNLWLYFFGTNLNYTLGHGYGTGHGYGYGEGDGNGNGFGAGDDYGTATGYRSRYMDNLLSFFTIILRNSM